MALPPGDSVPPEASSTRPEIRGLRSRTGCWACRTRSVKCDETKPVCRGCTKMGLPCHYGIRLQWMEDSIARGICHGREKARQRAGLARSPPASPGPSMAKRGGRSPRTANTPPGRAGRDATTYFINTSMPDVDAYLAAVQRRSRGLLPHSNDRLCRDDAPTGRADRDDAFTLPCTARRSTDERGHGQAEDERHEAWLALAVAQSWDADGSKKSRSRNSSRTLLFSVPHTINPAGLARSLDGFDGILLQFYDSVVCPSTTLLDDKDHNPFRFVLLPLAAFSPNILSAVLAIGATKLAYSNARFGGRALAYRQRVLANLTAMLEDIRGDVLRYLEALASALILCWCDITDHCQATWTKHLMGLASILDACPEDAHRIDYAGGLIQTCRQYLVYHLVMAKATFRTHAVFPHAESALARYLVRDNKDARKAALLPNDMHQIEPSQGFSNALLFLINDICNLTSGPGAAAGAGAGAGAAAATKTGVAQRVAELEEALQTLVQLPPRRHAASGTTATAAAGAETTGPATTPPPDEAFRTKVACAEAIAEANRLTALLFLDEMCALHFPDVVRPRLGQRRRPGHRADRRRRRHIQTILALVDAVCDTGPVTAALPIWPAFVAGCMVAGDDERLQVLRILDKFQRRRIFGSIPPACAVIENVWRQRDLARDENPRRPPSPTSVRPARHARRAAHPDANRPGQRGRTRAPSPKPAPGCARDMQYPWETALCVLRTSVLSLT